MCLVLSATQHRCSPCTHPLTYLPKRYVDYIRTLPYVEGPEIFGLHDNANISCALAETSSLLDAAMSLQPQTGGGAGKSWDETLLELAIDIAGKVSPPP